MEEIIKSKQGSYCPISVSDLATSNAKVRENSLREYSHAQNAAYRAFCRGPGRPQTAAFGRVYFATRLNRRSLSPDKADLRDCVVASKATVEERIATNYGTLKVSCLLSQPIFTERRLLPRAKTARRTLRHYAGELNDEESIRMTASSQPLEDTDSVTFEHPSDILSLTELDSSSEEKRSDTESNEEMNKSTPSEDIVTVSDSIERELTVYHFVDNGCSCMDAVNYHGDQSVGCRGCSYDQQLTVSSYSVEMRGDGHQSTPGLGNCDSHENKALWDLLQKQLSLVCY